MKSFSHLIPFRSVVRGAWKLITSLRSVPSTANYPNTQDKIHFRHNILALQSLMERRIREGALRAGVYPVKHHFTPIHERYGVCAYAREIFLPQGHIIIGKIHRHAHLNFILQGKVSVNTEFGKKYFEAPCVFVSEPGLKRAVFAELDTVWVTVHLTKYTGEENLDKIEKEVIAKTYAELGLIDDMGKLRIGERK